MEKHRSHAVGDATGRWRTIDGKFSVDASGVLPIGKSFHDPVELRGVLRASATARCDKRAVAEPLATHRRPAASFNRAF